jgi:hypothetical protein
MEQPSRMRTIIGGLLTAVKWLAVTAVVAGAITALAPSLPFLAPIAGFLTHGAAVAGLSHFGAFMAGAKGLFALHGIANLLPIGLGALGFFKGAVTTQRSQLIEINQRQMAMAIGQGQDPSPDLQPGLARGQDFSGPGHPANNRTSNVEFAQMVRQRQAQQGLRQP